MLPNWKEDQTKDIPKTLESNPFVPEIKIGRVRSHEKEMGTVSDFPIVR